VWDCCDGPEGGDEVVGPGPCHRINSRDIAGEHHAIAHAVVARDADLAGRLLAEHIRRTTDKLLETREGRQS
jgi:DNA-binding GntR family transcriptional regulator